MFYSRFRRCQYESNAVEKRKTIIHKCTYAVFAPKASIIIFAWRNSSRIAGVGLPDLEVTQRNARELARCGPIFPEQHPLNDADAVQPEVCTEESVKEEELADHVAGVEQLNEQVGAGEVSVVVEVA